MPSPSIVIAPYPRSIDEIFESDTWSRLTSLADVRWGRDEPLPEQELRSWLSDATAIAFGEWRYSRDTLLAAGKDLRALFEVMGGHDHPGLEYATCFSKGIAVGSVAPAFGPVVAEMCLALTLAAGRGVAQSDRGFRAADETYLHAGNVGSSTLFGKTVGFVGCGAISRSLQDLCAPFGVKILGYDPWLADEVLQARQISRVDLDELFMRSDVVFALAVPTPENRSLVSRELMEFLEPTNVLVVASRAHIVDFDALTELVSEGRFRAGIDVYPREPLPADHPIRNAPGAVLTAHLAGALPEALHEIGRMIVDDFEAILAGESHRRLQYATPQLIASLRT